MGNADSQRTASIIIPCTRINSVKRTVDSLLCQINCLDNYEIIIVGRELTNLKEIYSGRNINLLETSRSWPASKARNLGAKFAKSDILIFIDDDCEALPGLINNYLCYLVNRDIGVVTGKIVGKSDTFFNQCLNYSNFHSHLSNHEKEMERFISATFAIRKEIFDSLRGFDERFFIHEDVEFSLRLRQTGLKIIYSPRIVVFHNHGRNTFSSMIKYHYRSGALAGLDLPLKYQNYFKTKIKYHFRKYYFLLILPLAIWSTCKALKETMILTNKFFLFIPFIFLNQLSYQIGVFRWSLSSKK